MLGLRRGHYSGSDCYERRRAGFSKFYTALKFTHCLDHLPLSANVSTQMLRADGWHWGCSYYVWNSIHPLINSCFQDYGPDCQHFTVNNSCQFAFQQVQWSGVNSISADSFSSPHEEESWCCIAFWSTEAAGCETALSVPVMDFSLNDC